MHSFHRLLALRNVDDDGNLDFAGGNHVNIHAFVRQRFAGGGAYLQVLLIQGIAALHDEVYAIVAQQPVQCSFAGIEPFQEGGQFAEATETVPELIDLYEAADSECRLNPSPDVKVVVACVSRSIYGAALNERNWCMGREGEPNAMMEWHECEADSLRFPPVDFDG